MKVALTGTPGTGKTTAAKILEKSYYVVYLNSFKEAWEEYDDERDSYIVNIDTLREIITKIKQDAIIEGHYAHDMPVDIAIVLRCSPDTLKKRLEARNYNEKKVMENMEAEAMGLITAEAIANLGDNNVYEVDTTAASPEAVAKAILDIIHGRGEKYQKRISYMEEILKWY